MFSVPERRAASPPRSPLPHPAACAAAISGCFLAGLLWWERGWVRPPRSRGRTLSCRALSQRLWTLPPGKAAARRRWQRLAPFLPAPRDAAELRAQLPGSRALTFPTARPALTFPNPAPGVGKPLRATQRDLLAGQAVRIPFRVPGQEGFCWFSVRPLDCFPWGRSHKEKALKALKC